MVVGVADLRIVLEITKIIRNAWLSAIKVSLEIAKWLISMDSRIITKVPNSRMVLLTWKEAYYCASDGDLELPTEYIFIPVVHFSILLNWTALFYCQFI